VLLLNVPPDRRGLIHEIDATRLKEFGEYVRKTFEDNKMNESHSYWKAKNGDFREYSIKQGETINTILLQEDIEKGQRVEVFKVEGLIDGSWNKLTEGTTIGYKRILRFEDVVPEKIRITIIETRVSANIKEIGAYYAGEYTTDTLDINLNYIDKDWVKVMETNPLTVDIQGKEIEISGFSYMPNQETESVYKYKFMLSSDGKKWSEPSSQREFGNIKNNPMRQYIHFDAPYKARYFKLEIMEGTEGGKPTINPSQIAIIIP
jgi:alpha-L-fucosidase